MGTFEREGTLDIRDLLQYRLQPSRALGPPDPGSPMESWAAGMPVASPPTQVQAPDTSHGMQPPVVAPTASVAGTESPMEQGTLDCLFLAVGLTTLAGETFLLNEEELGSVMDVVIGAYERSLRDRASALRARYVQSKEGRDETVRQASTSRPEVVRPLHLPQEKANVPPEEMSQLRPSRVKRRKNMRPMSGQEAGVPPSPPPA